MSGALSRFAGPGATAAELWLQFGVAAVAAAGLVLSALLGDWSWSRLQLAIVALLAFDIAGGIATNSTAAAKRWYHRKGRTARHHASFVALHGLHVLVAAAVFYPFCQWARRVRLSVPAGCHRSPAAHARVLAAARLICPDRNRCLGKRLSHRHTRALRVVSASPLREAVARVPAGRSAIHAQSRLTLLMSPSNARLSHTDLKASVSEPTLRALSWRHSHWLIDCVARSHRRSSRRLSFRKPD